MEPLNCPAGCGRLAPLVCLRISGVPHEDADHYQGYVYCAVGACLTCGSGLFRWLDHNCAGYPTSYSLPIEASAVLRLTPTDVDRLREGVRQCPDPDSGTCRCAVHEALTANLDAFFDLSLKGMEVTLVDGLPRLKR